MAEAAFHRLAGDQTTPGYRPLPGSGPSRGTDLRTTVVAGLGIALGIFAGTFLADGTVQRMMAGPSRQMAEVRQSSPVAAPVAASPGTPSSGTAISGTANPGTALSIAAIPAVTTPQAAGSALLPATAVAAAVAYHEASAAGTADATTGTTSPTLALKLRAAKAGGSMVASTAKLPTAAQESAATNEPAASKVLVVHRSHLGHRLASRRVHLARRHRHARHEPLRAALNARRTDPLKAADLDTILEPFGFTVEGSLTVSSFDSSQGMLQTYEGEDFAVGRATSSANTIAWLQYPSDVHYRCDQSGNCTLIQGRVVVASARRTK